MRPADGRGMHSAALSLTGMVSTTVWGDYLSDIPEEREMGDGKGDHPPMPPGVVGEGHETGKLDVVLKATGRRHSYVDAVSGRRRLPA